MKNYKVLVTCPPMLKNIDQFRYEFDKRNIEIVIPKIVQVLSEDELIEIVPEVDGWIIGDDPATEKVFTSGKNGKLKAAIKWGVGVDNVDFEACAKLGIPITNTPRMFGNEVADMAVGYLIGLARQSFFVNDQVKKGNWVKPTGISVSGKTIAIIGLGDIGQSIIKRLSGFDVKILGYDPVFKADNFSSLNLEFNIFPENIDKADFVVLCCALTESSYHFVNKKTIEFMKDGVMIINVARGALINEDDLANALNSGKVKSAALDVFEVEPLPLFSKLRNYEQCIFGTHNGSNTLESVTRATNLALSKLFQYLNV